MNRISHFVLLILLLFVPACQAQEAPQNQQAQALPPIEVFFSPKGGCTEAVVRELGNAKATILVQAYSFTSAPIAKALLNAHKRGVKVDVILDKSQKSEKYSEADFLVNMGIPTKIDAKHQIAHNKIMVIDGQTVITGSFNFTTAAEEKNAENLLVIRDMSLAEKYMANVTAMVYQSLAICPRCVFVGIREWLIEDQGVSPEIWRLPPRGSPTSHEKSSTGPSYDRGENRVWNPGTIRSYDACVERLRDFGPSSTFWHNLMIHYRDDILIKRDGEGTRITLKANRQRFRKADFTPRMLFDLWQGEYALSHERDMTWAGEYACARIVADLIGEEPQRQWTTPWLVNPETHANLFVDAFYPKHCLAVEHQGQQHYEPLEFFGGLKPFEELVKRDAIKAALLHKHGIKLLAVRHDQVDRACISKLLQALMVRHQV